MKIDLTRYIDFQIPPEKKFENLQCYASLAIPKEIIEDYCNINHLGCVTSNNKDLLVIVQTDDKHFSLLPGPEFSPRMYRGQTAFHDQCVPSLFRNPTNKIEFIINILKKYEFYKLMSSHPITNYLHNWKIGSINFKVDMEGMAAHYEFGTQFIDVSRSKDVAMFFALCEMNDNKYIPIMDESRVSVLYTIDFKKFIQKNMADFHVVGFQALPRPEAQKAYAINVGYKQNFNDYKSVTCEFIRVNNKQSKKYFELFEGGKLLFPSDPIDEWTIQIRNSRKIDIEVLEYCFEKNIIPTSWSYMKDMLKFIGKFNYTTCEKKLQFSKDDTISIINNWNKIPPLSLERVKCRFCADPLKTEQ